MKLNKKLGFMLSVVLLSACATPTKSPAPAAVVMAPDQSEPTLPMAVTTPVEPVDVEIQKPVKLAEPMALPARGSVKSIVQKMEASPNALYWKEKHAYSYYIGGVLNAEYKIDVGLTVKEAKGDGSGIVCEFGRDGLQAKEGVHPKADEICSKLMFTLDDELSD